MYYDRNSKVWNDAACVENDSDRCVKMDCHEKHTHFSLLGIYKFTQDDNEDWMEQLYKHMGYCLWSEDEFEFMYDAYASWVSFAVAF